MQDEVITVAGDMNMPDLQRRFMSSRVGALPVVGRDSQLEGIVSRMDVLRRFSLEQSLAELADSDFDQTLGVEDDDDSLTAIGAEVGRRLSMIRAHDIMVTDVVTIGPEEPVEEAARRMLERRIHRLPVVEQDRLVGIVSAFDFMQLFMSGERSR